MSLRELIDYLVEYFEKIKDNNKDKENEEQAFKAVIRPDGIDTEEYFTKEKNDTIAWHAKQRGVSSEEIISSWKEGQSEKIVWKNFCNYCSKYEVDKKRGQWFVEPIPSGYNIVNFDLVIARRLAKKHKTTSLECKLLKHTKPCRIRLTRRSLWLSL